MASNSEAKILEDLRKLASGQTPSSSDPEYMELLTTRFMQMAEANESSLQSIQGEQTQEESGFETQRGEESLYAGADLKLVQDDPSGGVFQAYFESSILSTHINQIELLMDYISRFTRDELVKKYWQDLVLPPLRNTIGKIFTTQGAGTWKQISPEWADEKANPAIPGFSLGGKGKSGSGILSWRQRYRRALTGKKGLPNAQNPDGAGTTFAPLQGGNWKSGFEYGVDVGWFQDFTRRARGDDLELSYPIKHEGGYESTFRYISNIPADAASILGAFGFNYNLERKHAILVTTKQAKRLEKIGVKSYETYDWNLSRGKGKNTKGTVITQKRTFDIPARPVWGLFRNTNIPIIRKFYDRLGERMTTGIARYMDKAEREKWYRGDPSDYRSARQGSSLRDTESQQAQRPSQQRSADEMSYSEIYSEHGDSEAVRRHLYEEMDDAIAGGKGLTADEHRIYRELEDEFEYDF